MKWNEMKWNEDRKNIEVDIVVKDVWRKGGELIGIEVHERREERNEEEWGGNGKRKWNKISEIGEGWLMEWFQWVWMKVHCDVEWKWGWRGIEEGIWEGWGHWRHQGEWRWVCWNKKNMRDWMWRCGCEMMIKCEVKTGQTVESIENTRREEGNGVGEEWMREEIDW